MSIVAGDIMNRSIEDFVNACEVAIEEERREVSPRDHIIALLCDAVRLSREYVELARESPR